MERNRCDCGRVISKYAHRCKKCHEKKMNELVENAREIVAKGKCPNCGSNLVHNAAILGWYQCVQFGRWKETHGNPQGNNCGFQTFTER